MKLLKKMTVVLVTLGVLAGCSSGSGAASDDSGTKEAKKSEEVTIYFTRHGKTMLNMTGRGQGWSDAPLTPAGIEVAEDVGKGIGDNIRFDRVYSSDSGRALETTELLLKNAKQDVPITKEKRIREYNFGTFEGSSGGEMISAIAEDRKISAEEYTKILDDKGFIDMTKELSNDLAVVDKKNVKEGENWPAENYETVAKRGKEAVDEIVSEAQKNGDKSILVVSHGMTIATILSEMDESIVEDFPRSGLENASISKAIYKDGKWEVESVNDMSYLEK